MNPLTKLARRLVSFSKEPVSTQPADDIRFGPIGAGSHDKTADEVWRECIEQNLYGANTSDYAIQPTEAAPSRRKQAESGE